MQWSLKFLAKFPSIIVNIKLKQETECHTHIYGGNIQSQQSIIVHELLTFFHSDDVYFHLKLITFWLSLCFL